MTWIKKQTNLFIAKIKLEQKFHQALEGINTQSGSRLS